MCVCTETNQLSSYRPCRGGHAWNNISSWPSGIQPASQIPANLFESNSGESQLPVQNSAHYFLNPILIPQGFYPTACAGGKAQPGHSCRAEELATAPGGWACLALQTQGLLKGHFRTALKRSHKASWTSSADLCIYGSISWWQRSYVLGEIPP